VKYLRCRLCHTAGNSTKIPHDDQGAAKMRAHLESVHGVNPAAGPEQDSGDVIKIPPAIRLDRL
jgi:hypothetical protein